MLWDRRRATEKTFTLFMGRLNGNRICVLCMPILVCVVQFVLSACVCVCVRAFLELFLWRSIPMRNDFRHSFRFRMNRARDAPSLSLFFNPPLDFFGFSWFSHFSLSFPAYLSPSLSASLSLSLTPSLSPCLSLFHLSHPFGHITWRRRAIFHFLFYYFYSARVFRLF